MTVCFIGLFSFPDGGAPSSRLRSMALGLKEAGAEVIVLSYDLEQSIRRIAIEREFQWKNISCFGYDAVSVKNSNSLPPNRTRLWDTVFITRKRQLEMRAMLERLEKLLKNKLVDVVVFYNQEPEFALLTLLKCRQYGVPFVQQYTEYHLADDYPKRYMSAHWIREKIHMFLLSKISDGNIVISTYLQDKCKSLGGKNLILIPALTNTEMVVSDIRQGVHHNKQVMFTYLGKGIRRDCLEDVLRAAAILKNDNLLFEVQLIGLSSNNANKYRRLIEHYSIHDAVSVSEWVSDQALQEMFNGTDVFIVLRSDDQSSKACFPTRLPEMLLMRRPVILTTVGDFNIYFKNMHDAILVPPNDSVRLSEKMKMIILNKKLISKIGNEGTATCHKYFNYTSGGKLLAEYLMKSIISS